MPRDIRMISKEMCLIWLVERCVAVARELCEKERSEKTVMCLQRERAPSKTRQVSTKVVEERKIVDVLKIGRA